MEREVYLDNSATTRPFDEILDNLGQVFSLNYGNPSSLHVKGLESEKILKQARQVIANSLEVNSGEIFFTSGGTESNNIALKGSISAFRKRLGAVVTTKIEHPSVLDVFANFEKQGIKVFYIPVDNEGIIKIEELERILISQNVSVVSIMHVNNEVGSVQPIEEIIKLKKRFGFLLHVDCVQSYCKLKISHLSRNMDFMSFSGHKIHALKGIGGLYIRNGVKIDPLFQGGGQENGVKPGTENIPGIWSLGKAVEIITSEKYGSFSKIRELKNYLVNRTLDEIPNSGLNGTLDENKSAPHIANIWFKGIPAEVMLHALEEKGIFVSTGSACSSRKKHLSHVLTSMEISEEMIKGAIRVSLSINTNKEDIDYTIQMLKKCVEQLRGK